MERSHNLKETKATNMKANSVSNSDTNSTVKLHETSDLLSSKCHLTLSCRDTDELHAMPNIIIVEYHEERRLELTQFFENSYAGIFHIATFSNIVQALLHVNQDTSIFIFDCHYFDKASTKILRFVKNRNKKTVVISRFDAKKTAVTIDGVLKRRFHPMIEKTTIQMEIDASGLQQVVFPFRFSKLHHSAHKNYQYLIVLLLIAITLFLINL